MEKHLTTQGQVGSNACTHPSFEVTLLTQQTVHPSAKLSLNVASIPEIGSLLVLDGYSSPAHPMGISPTSSSPVNTHRPTSFKVGINLTINWSMDTNQIGIHPDGHPQARPVPMGNSLQSQATMPIHQPSQAIALALAKTVKFSL